MSILIKGIEMPKNCGECFACKAELSQEKKVIYVCCFTRQEYVSDENRVETDCPLVSVQPHGRLIDAEVAEVISFNEEEADGKDFMDGILHAADWISKQPTIIPADEPKEEVHDSD